MNIEECKTIEELKEKEVIGAPQLYDTDNLQIRTCRLIDTAVEITERRIRKIMISQLSIFEHCQQQAYLAFEKETGLNYENITRFLDAILNLLSEKQEEKDENDSLCSMECLDKTYSDGVEEERQRIIGVIQSESIKFNAEAPFVVQDAFVNLISKLSTPAQEKEEKEYCEWIKTNNSHTGNDFYKATCNDRGFNQTLLDKENISVVNDYPCPNCNKPIKVVEEK